MLKNQKITIACVAVVAAIAGAVTVATRLSALFTEHSRTIEQNTFTGNDVEDKQYYTAVSSAELSFDNSNPNAMIDKSSAVAIVTIKSIDGASNYGSGIEQYVYPYTYGEMEVVQTLAGDIPEGSTVKFSRLGGIMPFDEYLKGLSESEQTKITSLNTKRKDVKIAFEGDIDIEVGKTYLAYLVESTVHHAEPGAYEIIGFEGGLREIQTTGGYSANSNIKVLNNFTGEWENLSDIVK